MVPPVTPPNPGAAGWRTAPPKSYTFASEGLKALYAWTKDAAGNVSALSLNATVYISTGTGTNTSGHDFNGDGLPDLLWRNTTTGEVDVWYLNGSLAKIGGAMIVAPNTVPLNWVPIAR